MCFYTKKIISKKGQASLEAAYLIPVFFLLLLLLIQPGLVLYNYMVMQAAANEGCRLLATKTDTFGQSDEKYQGYILRRLGSIPDQDNFHIHQDGCSWEIIMEGNETTQNVTVTIKNKLKFLPLISQASGLLGLLEESGLFVQEVSVSMPTQPGWVATSEEGLNPPEWVSDSS
jgi:hypothetical protein